MKVYVEEIEELSGEGVTTYSLVHGMDAFRAEVRASGIEIFERDAHNEGGAAMEEDDNMYETLKQAVVKESYKRYE